MTMIENKCPFREDVILHECTPRFKVSILRRYLGDLYDFVSLRLPGSGEIISPHHIGDFKLTCDK